MYTILWLVFNIASARNSRVGRLARRQYNLVQNAQSAKSGNDYDYYRIHQQRNQFRDASGSKLHRKHSAYGDLARNEYNDRLRNYDGLHGERAHLSVKDASHNAAQLDDLAQDYYDYAQYYADFDWTDPWVAGEEPWAVPSDRGLSISVATCNPAGINTGMFEYKLADSKFQTAIDAAINARADGTISVKLTDLISEDKWPKWDALTEFLKTATFQELVTQAYDLKDDVKPQEKLVKLFSDLDRLPHYTPLKIYPNVAKDYQQCLADLRKAVGKKDKTQVAFADWHTKWTTMWDATTSTKLGTDPKKEQKVKKDIMQTPSKLTDTLAWGVPKEWDQEVALQRFEFVKTMLEWYDRLIWNIMFDYLIKLSAEEATKALDELEGSTEGINRKKQLVLGFAKKHSVLFVQEYVRGKDDVTYLETELGLDYEVHSVSSGTETHLIIVKDNDALFGTYLDKYSVPVFDEKGKREDGEGFYVEYEKIIFGTFHASGKDPKTCANWLKLAIESEKMFIVGADCNEDIFKEGVKDVEDQPRNEYLHGSRLVVAPTSGLPTVSKERSRSQYQWLKAGVLDTGAKDAIFANPEFMASASETGIFYVEKKEEGSTETKLTEITKKEQVIKEGEKPYILLPTDAFPFDHFMVRTVVKLKAELEANDNQKLKNLLDPSKWNEAAYNEKLKAATTVQESFTLTVKDVKETAAQKEKRVKKNAIIATGLVKLTVAAKRRLDAMKVAVVGAHREYGNYKRFEQYANDEEFDDDEYKLLKAMYFEGVRDGKRQEWKHLYSRNTGSKRRSYIN